VLIFILVALWGCSQSQLNEASISVSLHVDQKELQLNLAEGSTVQEALKSAQITLGELDEVEPGLSVIISDGAQIKVTRIKEEYSTEQIVIPFEHQELKNETLPEGERRLSQPGANGLEETTYRRIFEDGVEVSNSEVKSVVIREAVPEVEIIGSRSIFPAIAVPGKIAYLSGGNAWITENTTGNRKQVVSTGDLDGRVFSLSRDGKYLLFTRFSKDENAINTLWAASLESDPIKIIDLRTRNIVHYAEFNPSCDTVAYSTVEWREPSPGWQANNDLYELVISTNATVDSPWQDLEPGSGGIYGWWGTEYAWSPDGARFLYSRPDSIGIIDSKEKTQSLILDILPYQTGGDWAWVPGAAWSPDGNIIYAVNHVISETETSHESQEFDLIAIPLLGGTPVTLVKNVGMFAYPVPSPVLLVNTETDPNSRSSIEQADFSIAFLRAQAPDQIEASTYRLFTIDQDGSNQKALFPGESTSGLSPQHIAWSPDQLGADGNYAIALVYNGNIWIIDAVTGAAQQVTGDGMTTRVDWR
jgi:hypothetical protein